MEKKTKSEISNYIETPFDDETLGSLIKALIETYNFDPINMYQHINRQENADEPVPEETGMFENMLMEKSKSESSPIITPDVDDFWVRIKSTQPAIRSEGKPIRIVLNLKGKDKTSFAERYIEEMDRQKLPFHFKFSRRDTRDDQVVIEIPRELFRQQLELIKGLVSDFQLGSVPALYGKLKENPGIGIGEAFDTAMLSTTYAKVVLIKYALAKYLYDYIDRGGEISETAKSSLDKLCPSLVNEKFITRLESAPMPEWRARGALYRNHISEPTNCKYLSLPFYTGQFANDVGPEIRRILAENPRDFYKGMIDAYRAVATEGWGFSDSLVFSKGAEQYLLENVFGKSPTREATENDR